MKHILPYISLSLLLLSGIYSCRDIGETLLNGPTPGGVPATYSYKGYNPDGTLVVSGTMTLMMIDSVSVKGTWAFDIVSSNHNVGPQVGSANLAGTLLGSTISINLNPGWADNNVFLVGTQGPDRINGKWTWATFIGPTAEGAFEALRK